MIHIRSFTNLSSECDIIQNVLIQKSPVVERRGLIQKKEAIDVLIEYCESESRRLDVYASKHDIVKGMEHLLDIDDISSYGGFTVFYLCLAVGNYQNIVRMKECGCNKSIDDMLWYVNCTQNGKDESHPPYVTWNVITLYNLYQSFSFQNKNGTHGIHLHNNYNDIHHKLKEELVSIHSKSKRSKSTISDHVFLCNPYFVSIQEEDPNLASNSCIQVCRSCFHSQTKEYEGSLNLVFLKDSLLTRGVCMTRNISVDSLLLDGIDMDLKSY